MSNEPEKKFAPGPRVHADNIEYGDEDAMFMDGKLFTGVAYEVYDNGQVREETSYVNGYENGLCRDWYRNGQLKEEHVALPGRPADLSTGWHEDGALSYVIKREFGVRVSHQAWDGHGKLLVDEQLEPGSANHTELLKLRETGGPWK